MPASQVLEQIASHGVIGLLAVIACVVAWQKDAELKAERESRLKDRNDCSAELTALHARCQEELSAERNARLLDEQAHTKFATSSSERLFAALDTTKQLFDTVSKLQPPRR